LYYVNDIRKGQEKDPSKEDKMEGKRDWLPMYIVSIALIVVVAAFTVLYFQLNSRTADNNSALATQTAQVASLQSQLSAANSQVSTLGGQVATLSKNLASADSTISTLSTQLTSVNSQITSLTKQINTTGSQIAALQGQTSSSGSQINTLQTQLGTLQNAINELKSQSVSTQGAITSLQSQLNTAQSTLDTLTQQINTPVTLFAPRSITQAANTNSIVYSFVPAYSGYISISGISSSTTGYITIVNDDLGTSNTYNFGKGTTVYVQLSNSYHYSIYFGNHDVSGTITATLSGMYQL
jgi:septal ring factor EnvC (AmiA/AmiB activator)